jgi:hypothetical protein
VLLLQVLVPWMLPPTVASAADIHCCCCYIAACVSPDVTKNQQQNCMQPVAVASHATELLFKVPRVCVT